MGLGQAELYFWDEFPGRLPLLGKRFRAMGGLGWKKVSPCHLYDSTLLILSGLLGHLRTFERKLGHLRTWRPFFCSSLDLEWKLGHLQSWRPFLFALQIRAALGFKIFYNAALCAKSLPTPGIKETKTLSFCCNKIGLNVRAILGGLKLTNHSNTSLPAR